MAAPPVLNVHAPSTSFALIHSLTQESLASLFDKLSRKIQTEYCGKYVGPGWLKYEFNDTVWNLDDESDYAIFTWRQQQQQQQQQHQDEQHHYRPPESPPIASTSTHTLPPPPTLPAAPPTPTLHLHDPDGTLPIPPQYLNPTFYVFHSPRVTHPLPKRSPAPSRGSRRSKGPKETVTGIGPQAVPKFKQDFEKFHSENGVRTVMGSIGPVKDVRMLLRAGYRHVYISRKFAQKHGFIPADAAPGHYGYGGLVNIGVWPITLTPSSSSLPSSIDHTQLHASAPLSRSSRSASPILKTNGSILGNGLVNGITKQNSLRNKPMRGIDMHDAHTGPKPTMIQVYLSEEPHFDVVLGRSFFDKRQIRTSKLDLTDVVCLDTGEKIECELVILKDGRGEIVTVT